MIPLPAIEIRDEQGAVRAVGSLFPSGYAVIQFVDDRAIRPLETYESKEQLFDVYRSTRWDVRIGYAYVGSLSPTPTAAEEALERLPDWALFGDGRWRTDTVCSMCGSWTAGVCAHKDNPEREIILRSEYDRRASSSTPTAAEEAK